MSRRVDVFISFDIEGTSAVSSWREVGKDSHDLERMRRLATGEVNAAVRGIKKSGMDYGTILVCDAHASGENLLIDELEKGVELVKGTPREYYMMQGIGREHDVTFFIGYHAMAGTQRAGMDHTYSSASIYNIKINGQYVGESAINAAVAGHFGVPLGLVTGDDRLIAEVRKFFGRSVETVATKKGISRFAARSRLPDDVQSEIETKAARAAEKIDKLRVFRFREPLRAEVDLANTVIADLAELIPGVKRTSGRAIAFRSKGILEFYRMLRLVCCLGGYAITSLT